MDSPLARHLLTSRWANSQITTHGTRNTCNINSYLFVGEGTSLSAIITVILVVIGVSTVAIVAIVIYFMCRRSKAREAASHEHRIDPPHDPLDDAFVSYVLCCRSNTHSPVRGTPILSGGVPLSWLGVPLPSPWKGPGARDWGTPSILCFPSPLLPLEGTWDQRLGYPP